MKSITTSTLACVLALAVAACSGEESSGAPAAGDSDRKGAAAAADAADETLEGRMARGERLYAAHCAACHQAKGQGLAAAFPPLAASDYLSDGPAPAIDAVLKGLRGRITVNGVEYNGVMPNLSYLSDSEVADVVTYVMNSWGNPGGVVEAAEVAAARGR